MNCPTSWAALALAFALGVNVSSCATLLGVDGDYGDWSGDAGRDDNPGADGPALSAPGGSGDDDDAERTSSTGMTSNEPEPGANADDDTGMDPSDDDPGLDPSDDDVPMNGKPGGAGGTSSDGEAGAGGSSPMTTGGGGGFPGLGGAGGDGDVTGGSAAGGFSGAVTTEIRIGGVQSGTTSVTTGDSSRTVEIQAVDPARSVLLFGSAFDSTNAGYSELTGQIANSTEITFQRNSTSSSAPTIPVRYYVAEFQSGVRVQRGSRVLENATEIVALDDAVDPSRSIPLISFRNEGSVYGLDDFVRAELSGPSELSLSMYQAFGVGVVEWQVVSFEDSSTSVQSGNVAFGSDDTVVRAPLAQAVDPAKTWLVLSYQVAEISELAHEVMVRGLIDSSDELVFERSGTGATIRLTYYAVSFGDGVNVQSGARAISDAERVVTTSLVPVEPSRSVALAAGCYQRAGATFYAGASNPGYATFLMDLGAGSELTLTRGASGDNATSTLNWFVVEFQ